MGAYELQTCHIEDAVIRSLKSSRKRNSEVCGLIVWYHEIIYFG